MKNIQQISVSLPQNDRKISDSHPDFTGKFEVKDEQWSAVAWLNTTKTGAPYVSLRLSDDASKNLKFPIWKAKHELPEDPHFESTEVVEGRAYHLQAWLLPAGANYRLELTIEAVSPNGERSVAASALETSKKRIADFLAESGVAILPPNPAIAKAAKDEDEDLDNIPF
jgi:hypothetical protein